MSSGIRDLPLSFDDVGSFSICKILIRSKTRPQFHRTSYAADAIKVIRDIYEKIYIPVTLLIYQENGTTSKQDDERFNDEKTYLLRQFKGSSDTIFVF